MTIINYYTSFSRSLMKKTENKICSSVLLSKRHQQGKMFFCPSVKTTSARKNVLLSFCQNDISKEKCLSVLLSKRHQQGNMFFCPSVKTSSARKICLSVLLSKRHQQGKMFFLSFCQNDISKEICLSVLLSKRHQQGKMFFCPSVKCFKAFCLNIKNTCLCQR